jgi:Zn-dependent peptidase ImmA (M78 family)
MPGPVRDTRADALRERYRQLFPGPEVPVPVEDIAADLVGLLVEEEEIACSGYLLPARRLVVLNASEPRVRRRFTLAHELGHWVCQVMAGRSAPVFCRPLDLSEATDRALEREANVFAAELLMPEPLVRSRFAGSVADCAAAFAVSGEAMHWRLFNLGLVPEPPAAQE